MPIDIDKRNRSIYKNWLKLRVDTKNEYGKLCYCGHTYKCDCADPDEALFRESVMRNTITIGDKNNGWKCQ